MNLLFLLKQMGLIILVLIAAGVILLLIAFIVLVLQGIYNTFWGGKKK